MRNTLSQPAWVENTLRLDPKRFPQQASYVLRGHTGNVTISLDERGAVLRKVLPFKRPAAFDRTAGAGIQRGRGTRDRPRRRRRYSDA